MIEKAQCCLLIDCEDKVITNPYGKDNGLMFGHRMLEGLVQTLLSYVSLEVLLAASTLGTAPDDPRGPLQSHDSLYFPG